MKSLSLSLSLFSFSMATHSSVSSCVQKSNFGLIYKNWESCFQCLKHLFWLRPFSHFLILQRDKASWENNFYTLIWRKTLELYFNLHVPSARYCPEQPEVAKATILGTEPLHTNFWVGMFSFLMGMYRSREKTAELCSGYAELVFLPLPVLRWLLSSSYEHCVKVEVLVVPPTSFCWEAETVVNLSSSLGCAFGHAHAVVTRGGQRTLGMVSFLPPRALQDGTRVVGLVGSALTSWAFSPAPLWFNYAY